MLTARPRRSQRPQRAVRDNYCMSGYFTDESMIRRVHREHVVALSGARALLMQAAHPVAFAGFFMSTILVALFFYASKSRTTREIRSKLNLRLIFC